MMQRDDVESKELSITTPDAALPGDLNMPRDPRGLVLFAHGSGSSRLSPRNRYVAAALNHGGLATLLFDLLTPEEHRLDQATAELRFDIDLLSRRLGHAVDWVRQEPGLKHLSIGLFGASTGAAAALNVAASRPEHIAAVVSRGGRPDLA
ncbi:MAG TPA: acyl-CoA thioester hydrolase/BAAT C-terminal domain-containing protein, partial [Gammaproteobacteria bacterium]|nr:acyl-CoA thioester hydrolase/BAAT C-terminal domain-containing protein [Gammaproteobacteria bacterium]